MEKTQREIGVNSNGIRQLGRKWNKKIGKEVWWRMPLIETWFDLTLNLMNRAGLKSRECSVPLTRLVWNVDTHFPIKMSFNSLFGRRPCRVHLQCRFCWFNYNQRVSHEFNLMWPGGSMETHTFFGRWLYANASQVCCHLIAAPTSSYFMKPTEWIMKSPPMWLQNMRRRMENPH